jgi:hypothetical protein
MSKKITKKQCQQFVEKVCKGLLEMGAYKVNQNHPSMICFELNTIVGKLELSVPLEQTYIFTVFSCFEDVKKAKRKFPCNPHSGKYNFHVFGDVDETVKMALMMFESTVAKAKVRKDLLKEGISVPMGSLHYSGKEALPYRWIGMNEDKMQVLHLGQWMTVESIDWDFNS